MKALLTSATIRALMTIGLLSTALPACRSDAEAVCNLKCECEGCSAVQFDDCNLSAIDKEREADAQGCLDFYDALKACEYDTGICKANKEWDTACGVEKDRYDNCRK